MGVSDSKELRLKLIALRLITDTPLSISNIGLVDAK